ncbi:hypothetical protein PCANC_26986 [Puccinia coronata f. sp. avenae]|uniref:Uncharacterized protein n=1 Tax=Puccinia coronata f. sp. avenae TaxID=200324 RepID=A0A2N5TRQ2_9BASI|nr:hypothetical protein PCANC_26986 [Puccinia coronata f. sp. avenae]
MAVQVEYLRVFGLVDLYAQDGNKSELCFIGGCPPQGKRASLARLRQKPLVLAGCGDKVHYTHDRLTQLPGVKSLLLELDRLSQAWAQ